MAFHFHGNQFEKAYKARVLRNWEVPKEYEDIWPRPRTGRTKIIANDRGHLLPGVPKKADCSPWGNYIGTWQLPKKIDRRTANELSGLSKSERPKTSTPKVEPAQLHQEESQEETKEPYEYEDQILKHLEPECFDEEPEVTEEPAVAEKENICPYVPGDLTEDKHRLDSHEILSENRYHGNKLDPPFEGYPKYRDDFSKPLPEKVDITREQVEEFCKRNAEMKETIVAPEEVHCEHKRKKTSSPLIAAIRNFQMARKLHKENLEHDPLPDTIAHRKYCQMQMRKTGPEPGLQLDEKPYATGVGWKGHPGYGPTRCTKLKVYRPKTCPASKNKNKDDDKKNDGRPGSVTSFDRKWRFIRRSKVSPIELAICWDLTPENPQDEPKRTPHIDGSNGSMAPAVFALVHTPKEEEDQASRKTSLQSSGSVFECGDRNRDEFLLDRSKSARRRSSEATMSSESKKAGLCLEKRAKSAYNLERLEENEETGCLRCAQKDGLGKSEPNLRRDGRNCVACDLNKVTLKERPKDQQQYKMAFKAGLPQRPTTTGVSRKATAAARVVLLRMPKPKNPYSPRNYAIPTLAPPFSLQKDKREDYPDHWRLATVYQHSYKPIHTRKRTLLQTVFK